MGSYLLLFILTLFLIAAILREQFVLILLYLFMEAYLISHWWSSQVIKSVKVERRFTQRAYWGEQIPVRVRIMNTGWLPAVWLHARESLPVELRGSGETQRVYSIIGKGQADLEYQLDCRKRGYYPVGPLKLTSGDLLGITRLVDKTIEADHLTVFPKIIPLSRVSLPSQSPLGTLRYNWPIFEDPSRVRGKRDYVTGDSLRRVDWKSSARINRLQVKQYEPSIALETMIFLNLNTLEYSLRARFEATELGIVVAASLAYWITAHRQAVGLAINGVDPILGTSTLFLPPRRGRGHLMRVLESLARVQAAETDPMESFLQQRSVDIGWGATLILLTHRLSDPIFDTLFLIRRRGLSPVIIICGVLDNYLEVERRAKHFNLPIYHVVNETDLDIWRC